MIVILMKDVKGTGKAGDVVKVSDGYARNMLLPKGLAKEASDGNIRNLEKQKEIAAAKRAEQKAAAQETAEKLEKITLEIKTKGGESGKLFGSITSKDIADALEKQEKIKVDKKKIEMSSPIKQAGQSTVTIKLFSEVSAELKVNVTV
jgi:large subunit ribosomal protein L9